MLPVGSDSHTRPIAVDKLTGVRRRRSEPHSECPSVSLFTPVSPTRLLAVRSRLRRRPGLHDSAHSSVDCEVVAYKSGSERQNFLQADMPGCVESSAWKSVLISPYHPFRTAWLPLTRHAAGANARPARLRRQMLSVWCNDTHSSRESWARSYTRATSSTSDLLSCKQRKLGRTTMWE